MSKVFITALVMLTAMGSKAQVYNYEDGEGPLPPDSVSGFYIGLNLGVYWANKNTARIYGGYGYRRDGTLNDFSNAWLNIALNGPPIQNVNRTNDAMNATNGEWEFTEADMPGIMRYNAAFMPGLHLRYMFDSDFGLIMEFNGAFPVTVGQFTITRTVPVNGLQQLPVETFGIRGEEQRLFLNLGLHRVLGRKAAERRGKVPTVLPYVDLGATVLFTRFEANFIDLGEQVENFPPVVDLTVQYNVQGGVLNQANVLTGAGLGGFGGLGAQITLGRKFTIDVGYVANMQQVNLGEVREIGLQHQVIFRAVYM